MVARRRSALVRRSALIQGLSSVLLGSAGLLGKLLWLRYGIVYVLTALMEYVRRKVIIIIFRFRRLSSFPFYASTLTQKSQPFRGFVMLYWMQA